MQVGLNRAALYFRFIRQKCFFSLLSLDLIYSVALMLLVPKPSVKAIMITPALSMMLCLGFSPPDSNVTVLLRLLLKYRPCHGELWRPAIITLLLKTDSLLQSDMTPNSSAGSVPPRSLSVQSDMCKLTTPGWGRKMVRPRPQHAQIRFSSLCV